MTGTYAALGLALPVLWIITLLLTGGHDGRFIGTGSDEFRKVLNAGVSLTAAIAIFSYGLLQFVPLSATPPHAVTVRESIDLQ